MSWTPEAIELSRQLAILLGQDVNATPDRIHQFADWAAAQEGGKKLEQEVTNMAEKLPPTEINLFFKDPSGGSAHLKTFSWAGMEPNVIARVVQRMDAAGFVLDTGPGRGGNTHSAPVQAAQPSQAPKPARECGICRSGAVVEVSSRPKDTSPWYRCSSCDAAAWKGKDGEPSGWRASTRSG